MKKEKNGFTLIELLATISLMVLAGVVIVNNLSSLFSRQEDNNVEAFETLLEDAACTYIELSDPTIKEKKAECKESGCTILTSDLILNGLLEEDYENPVTNASITGLEKIQISYENGEKKCEYDAYGGNEET